MNTAEARTLGWGNKSYAFAVWWNDVDRAVKEKTQGMVGILDLPDWDFASAFDAGTKPADAAVELLQESGWGEAL